MKYTPENFNFHIDPATGNKVYDDPKVQIVYLSLKHFSHLIRDVQIDANSDITKIQNNVDAKAVHDQTAQFLAGLMASIIGAASVFFTAGTGPAIVAMLLGKISAAAINSAIKDAKPNDDILVKANEVQTGMDALFSELKHKIDSMVVDLEKYWTQPFEYEGTTHLYELADQDATIPDEADPTYDDLREYLQGECKKVITQQLLPVKWKIKTWDTFTFWDWRRKGDGYDLSYDIVYQQYNPHTDEEFWAQKFNANPASGSYYFIDTASGTKGFTDFLIELYNNPADDYRYSRYGSYYFYTEQVQKWDGPDRWQGHDIHQMLLVDSNGDGAPKVLTDWLFKDKSNGDVVNSRNIATRKEVYRDWNIPS